MPEPQIFKATYSGVPVYEMMVKTIAVMRRRMDGWLNATQILKVAGFDKPQRTRILEREVQKGEHEKVQGGYGKYQGTWVPAERGISLARQYNCDTQIRPIVEFIPHDRSPPPAPKHVNSAPAKLPKKDTAAPTNITTRSSGRKVVPRDTASLFQGSEDGSLTSTPSGSSASSRTPSPIITSSALPSLEGEDAAQKKRKKENDGPPQPMKGDPRGYSNQILEYFVSDTTQIPKFLVNAPADYDPNVPIDDDMHTALHWSSAMGRIKVVKYLLTAGADVFRVNKSGQTALMRSVMFANNYDVRKFTELYELLHRSTLNIDNNNRTVFHHIVDVAITKGKVHAARYYMETILNRLSDYPHELADIINFQDEDGETALTLAARCRSKRLVKLLIDHGADPKISNRDGKSAEDYILEDERYRFSPPLPHRNSMASIRNGNHGFATYGTTPLWQSHDRPSLHHSIIAQRASTKVASEISQLLGNLADSFDYELLEKERDTNQAHSLLANIEAEIIDSHRTILSLQSQASAADDAKTKLRRMEEALVNRMSARHRLGYEKWADEDMLVEPQTEHVEVEPFSDEACESVRQEIHSAQQKARQGFESFVKQQAEAGTGGNMGDFKRLIAAGCGTLSAADVDSVIDILLEDNGDGRELANDIVERDQQVSFDIKHFKGQSCILYIFLRYLL